MAHSSLLLVTYGSWDKTNLVNNGTEEVDAGRLLLRLTTDNRGGIKAGGEMHAYITPQDDPTAQYGIFPGRFELDVHSTEFGDSNVVIENQNPTVDFDSTQVWFNQLDVTDQVYELFIEFDYPKDTASAYLKLLKGSWWRGNTETDITLL